MITLTETAIVKIKKSLEKRGKGDGIKIGVKTTGCSGLAYVLEYVDYMGPYTPCHNFDGVQVFIDPKHEPYLIGMIVDYVKNGLNEGFEFRNPNEKDRCGCGESFRV